MEKTIIKEKDLRKIIRETIENEEPKTYYVANSSYFDTNSYRVDDIAKAVEKAGGKNIHIEPAYGWSNQPEVVGFEASEEKVKEIAAEVSRMLDTEWVHILEKEW